MLQLKHLNVYYGESHILRDVSFDLEAGQVACLMGRNGVGKTTLNRALSGLIRPAAGGIRFEGVEIAGAGHDAIVRAGLVQVREEVRRRVQFGQLNLCAPIESIGPFDVIFLRNVLLYFDAKTKSAVVDRVLMQLRPGGLFFLGTAEGRVPCRTPLTPLAPGAFRKD